MTVRNLFSYFRFKYQAKRISGYSRDIIVELPNFGLKLKTNGVSVFQVRCYKIRCVGLRLAISLNFHNVNAFLIWKPTNKILSKYGQENPEKISGELKISEPVYKKIAVSI